MKNIEVHFDSASKSLHIDGYPEGRRIAELPEPYKKCFQDLVLHKIDIQFCVSAMQRYGSLAILNREEHLLVMRCCMIAILTKFIGCFKKSKSREKLEKNTVFQNNNPALESFTYFEAVRDKHIAHDENSLNYSMPGVVLGRDDEVLDVVCILIQGDISSWLPPDLQNLYNLISVSLKYVDEKIGKLHNKALQGLRQKDKSYMSTLKKIKIDEQMLNPDKMNSTRDV